MAKTPPWSCEENEILATWYPEYGVDWERWDDLLPLRSRKAIQIHAGKIGVKCRYRGPRSWRKSEDRAAIAMLVEICRSTGRSPDAVINRLAHLVRENRKRARKRDAESQGKDGR